MFFDVARALEEGAPDLLLLEVHVFPEGPARVLDVEGAGAGEDEDGVLQAGGGVVRDVCLEEGEGARG